MVNIPYNYKDMIKITYGASPRVKKETDTIFRRFSADIWLDSTLVILTAPVHIKIFPGLKKS
jgi:hypothetical protein